MSNFIEFYKQFKDEEACIQYLAEMRWNTKPACVHCGHTEAYYLKTRSIYKCRQCRQQFSVRSGTIFEESRLPLQKWFLAIYLLTSRKKGISSVQLAKDIGTTQKTAWFVLQRIRYALGNGSFDKPKGTVEVDETYVGGKKKGKRGRGSENKSPVFGVIERGGKVQAQVVENCKVATLIPLIDKYIDKQAEVMTDDFLSYNNLRLYGFDHKVIKHAIKEYVRGTIHTNTIENFWSHLKRGLNGIYLQVSKKHLQKYVDEFTFRHNTRKITDFERFCSWFVLCSGRLEYSVLTAKE